jgi:hypothetical protein
MKRFTPLLVALILSPLPASAQVVYTTIAHTGEVVPNTNGATSFRFSSSVINNAGQVATDLTYDRATLKHALTLFPTPGQYNPIAFQGAPAPGATDNAPFGSTFANLTLNDIGQVHFKNYIGSDFTKDETLFTTPNPQSEIAISMFLTAREGNPAPGLPAGTIYTRVGAENYMIPQPVFGDGGQVAYVSGLSGGGTTTTNQHALFAGSPAGPTLVVRQGDPTPHPGFNYAFDFGSNLNINPAGQVAFRSSLLSNTVTYPNGGIFLATPKTGAPYAVEKLATLRETPPGSSSTFYSFSAPSLNSAGDVAFMGEAGVTTANQYLLVGRPGKLLTVAHTGDPIAANGPTAHAPLIANTFSAPILSTNGAVTFQATLAGATATSDTALFSGLPGHLKLIAREGDPTPAGPDTFFGDLSPATRKLMTNGHGQVAFAASLTGPGVIPATSQALFATDRAGQLMLIARYGQTYDSGDGAGPKTAGSWNTLYGSNGNDGLPSAFNDFGQLIYNLTFDSGTASEASALVRATIPLPGDATGDGIVNINDFKTMFNNLEKPGGQAQGDFNHDGTVDFSDFQLLEQWFGHSATDAPVPVSSADAAALNSFAQTIPDPGFLAYVPLVLTPFLLRRRAKLS